MATANASTPKTPHPLSTPPARRGRKRWIALAVLGLMAAVLALFWTPVHGYAVTGASYGARVACSCRFVGGRPLGDCRKDFEGGMELVTLSQDVQARSVTARFPLLASQTATYRQGWGCVLDKWER